MYPNLIKANRRMSTCNRSDLPNTRIISTGDAQKSPGSLPWICCQWGEVINVSVILNSSSKGGNDYRGDRGNQSTLSNYITKN